MELWMVAMELLDWQTGLRKFDHVPSTSIVGIHDYIADMNQVLASFANNMFFIDTAGVIMDTVRQALD